MINPEKITQGQEHVYFEGIRDFIVEQRKRGKVSCALVDGQVDETVGLHTFAALFHPNMQQILDRDLFLIGPLAEKVCDRILGLNTKTVTEGLRVFLDEEYRRYMEANFTLNGLPYVAFAIGTSSETKKDVTLLYFTRGMSPEDAIFEMRETIINDEQARKNAIPDKGDLFAS